MKENKRKIIGFLSVFVLLCAIAPTIVSAAEEGEALPAAYATMWALLPPIVAIALALIAIWQHWGNLQRLKNGTERKIGQKEENKA